MPPLSVWADRRTIALLFASDVIGFGTKLGVKRPVPAMSTDSWIAALRAPVLRTVPLLELSGLR